uniref:Lon protease homolog n=1 Tax=Homalodisca liturata TaxID=320908 RepID=A0A1B6K097_9HEMI
MAQIEIPKKLPLLLIQNDILLPGSSLRIPLSGSSSMNMVKSRLLSRNTLANSIVGIVTVEDISDFEKTIIDSKCKVIGTAAFVLQVGCSNWPKSNGYVLSTVGVCRFSLDKLVMEEPYPMGVVTQLDYIYPNKDTALSAECIKMAQKIQKLASTLLERLSFPAAQDMQKTVQNACYSSLPDIVVPLLLPSYEEKKEILYALDIEDRLKKAMVIIRKYTSDIKHMKKGDVPKTELFVISPKDQKLLQIRSKTGDNFFDVSDSVNEIDELQNKIVKANLPVEVNKVVVRDLHRLKKMGPFSPEHSIIRNYIEFVVELPWSTSSSETIDIHKARKDLDCEHYGMDKVKQRVLEYLAVRQLKSSARGPILCFVGPPGVGKTSIGRSIAHTLGRQFQRISLGGVSNQSDIRGHRRTYIGAMPGRIIQALKNAGVNNPVILLDEIDKMTSGVHGDPAAALLEVLDPLQNNHFIDHYLNVPFDLSQVTFIATANQVKTIPAPLLDRMETITVCGYTVEEKVYIAQQHLLPKQLTENGLDSSIMTISANSLKQLIGSYTSEAGVRNLERKLGALCRAVAVRVAEKDTEPASVLSLPVDITPDTLETILGPRLYQGMELWGRVGTPGVAVGLAWTVQGGCITMVEATKLAGGEGKLILTGHLGKVMRESAQLALNWVRGVAQQYGLVQQGEDLMNDIDVHIHFPEGAVSKDGPSAGITIATALVSLFADVPLVPGLAISGELTLRGVVLPVGGIREKLLAAHSTGLKKVILPKRCIKDLFYVPQTIKDEMSFLFVDHMEEVIDAAFDGLVAPVSHPSFQSKL